MKTEDIIELLQRLWEYMDDKADAYTEGDEWVCNDEFILVGEIDAAIKALEVNQ